MVRFDYRSCQPAILLASLTMPLAVASQAAEYSANYSVEARYEYNDNVRLSSQNETDISGGKFILPITLVRRSERLDTSLNGALSSSKYNESGFDSDDQDLQGKAAYQLERGEIKANAGFKRDSTLDSEFTDTGFVGQTASRKETATVGGSGDYFITEKNGLSGGFDYLNVDYQRPVYEDYDYISGYAGWLHQWSERTRLRLLAYANRYENQAQITVKSDGLGAQTGIDTELSEQLSLSLLAGWVETDTSYTSSLPMQIEDANDGTYLLDGSLRYQQERYEWAVYVNSGTTPSGNGTLLESDQLGLSYNYSLTELSRFKLNLLAGQNSSLDSRIDDNDRDYARAILRLDYRFSRQWIVAGSYTYSYQDQKRNNIDPGDADSNAVYLSLIWQPEERTWSR